MAEKPNQKTSRKEVWAVMERERGELSRISLELLSGGRKLAEKLAAGFAAVIFGNQPENFADVVTHYGVSRLYQEKNLIKDSWQVEKAAFLLGEQIRNYSPYLVLFGCTQRGEELSLRISAALEAPLLPHCESLEVGAEKKLVATRPVYGGHFSRETVGEGDKTILASVLPRKWNPEPAKVRSQSLDLVDFPEIPKQIPSPSYEVLETVQINPEDMDLSSADVVVGGGRGVRKVENFTHIEQLAALLNGVVGGSRVAVCNGWIPFDRQIGQTGKTIAPRLYIACGISGAIHHQMGIRDSELIMAINTDKNAPIFKLADVGVVGDINEMLPEIVERLTSIKEEKDAGKH